MNGPPVKQSIMSPDCSTGGSFVIYNKVEICGVDTSKLTVLKEADKIDLLKKMHAGDKTAREKLINGNLRLVLSVIQRFVNRGEKSGRSVPGRLHWFDESNRQF